MKSRQIIIAVGHVNKLVQDKLCANISQVKCVHILEKMHHGEHVAILIILLSVLTKQLSD